MVVCRFFLKGSCKFGDRCRNEHPRNTSEYNAYPSQSNWQQGGNQYPHGSQDTYQDRGSGHQSYYNQGNSSGTASGNQNRFAALSDDYQANNKGRGSGPGGFGDGGNDEPRPGEILESIKRDAEEWDVSKMWPYSCYRPSRAQGDVPGLQDLSPEELRLEAYIAAKENRLETYILLQAGTREEAIIGLSKPQADRSLSLRFIFNVQGYELSIVTNSKSAVSLSTDALKRKLEMMKKPSGELKNALISLYRGQQKTGSFGGQSFFGMQDISTLEIFTKSGSTLFKTSNTSGTLSSTSPPAGLFSNPSSASSSSGVFGSTTLGTGFGTQPVTPSSPPHGLFGNPSGTTSSFGSTAPSSGFGNSGGLFGKPDSQNTGLFGQPAPTGTGLFGKPGPPAGAPFGQSSSQSVGLFGKPAPSGGGGQSSNEKWYTPISEFTAEEKEQFEAPSFTLGKIPTRPPPLELVNTAA